MVGLNCVSSSSSLWWSQAMCVSRATEIMASGVSWVRCGGGCCGLSVHSSDGTKWTARAVAGRVEAQVEAQQEQRHRRAQHVHGPRQMTRSFEQNNFKIIIVLALERSSGVACKSQRLHWNTYNIEHNFKLYFPYPFSFALRLRQFEWRRSRTYHTPAAEWQYLFNCFSKIHPKLQ